MIEVIILNKFEELCQTASDTNVDIVNYSFSSSRIKGLYCNGNVAINNEIDTDAERICVLAEELGHHVTTSGNILDQSSASNRKQERIARMWAYNRLIGLRGIVDCYNAGCQNTYEMAETLNVTEDFLLEALFCYKEKYGVYAQMDNYIVYFIPTIGVCEIR